MKKLLLLVLRGYKYFVSPMLPNACRFTPTCSEFATEAVAQYGAIKGSWMTIKRLARCHPFHAGGLDPVPYPTRHSHSAISRQAH